MGGERDRLSAATSLYYDPLGSPQSGLCVGEASLQFRPGKRGPTFGSGGTLSPGTPGRPQDAAGLTAYCEKLSKEGQDVESQS